MPKTNVTLLALALISAIGYLALPLIPGSLPYIGVKALCCLFLALLAFLSVTNTRHRKLLVVALLVSSLGDIFLAIRSADYFIQGLGSFLIAHILYIAIFARTRLTTKLSPVRMTLISLVVLFSLTMMWLLWPLLGALKAPVYIYITVISLMAISAIYSSFDSRLAITGSLSFLISDATIAIDKFIEPLTIASPLIWVTYVTAQILLTLAIIKGPQRQNADIAPA